MEKYRFNIHMLSQKNDRIGIHTFTSKAKNAAVAKLEIMTDFVYFCSKLIIK